MSACYNSYGRKKANGRMNSQKYLRNSKIISTFEGTDLVRNAHEPTSKVRSRDAAHTSVRSEDMCFFRHAPSLKGWVPSEKSRGCCSTLRAPWLRIACIFCSTFGRRLGFANSPESTFTKCSASITRLNTPILCEHNRHISPYNKKDFFFLKKFVVITCVCAFFVVPLQRKIKLLSELSKITQCIE